ncbi:MAG: S9 family peptidase [Acidobacteria bacterium]|nr:S9 family peptidase [Acidobacteriota bacterium]
MKTTHFILAVICFLLMVACTPAGPVAPVAEKKPHELETHGDVRIDDYYWLRERENPEVLAYLEAENAYTEAMMAKSEGLRHELFEELKNRIQPDDSTVPALDNGYYYYRRYEEGQEYPVYCRRKGSIDAAEEVVLDVNQVADGHDFCSVRGVSVSPDSRLMAWAIDTVGRRKYTINITDLETGEALDDVIPEVTGGLAWANDNTTMFYAKQDPETLRSFQVYRHVLGTEPSQDVLIYEESDPTFSVGLWKTRSDRFIVVHSEQTMASEVRFLDADNPMGDLRLIAPRQRGVEYSVNHAGDRFIIRTNLDAENFRLMAAPVSNPGRSQWSDLIPGREDVFLQGVDVFADHMVVTERRDGLRHLRVIPWGGGEEYEIEFDDPAYVTWVDENPQFETGVLRYGYSSPNTPETIYDLDLETHERTMMKQETILGGFDSTNYTVERLMAPARDGVEVPISLVRLNDLELDGSNPMLLYGYGSYGYSMDPRFRPDVVSLLDRGFVFAIAHVRGGQEMGRWWYEDGKLLNKKNTFTDFIDCGRYLVDQGYTSPDRLFARGGSAGGLLMGAVSNMAPDLFAGIIANVPWVDVVTTMLDHDIPLTTAEFDEWGNPEDLEYYDYMLSYSPYDNVEAKDYPALLVTTALEDSQVQYFEPAKWVAKLRTMKTDDNPLLFTCEMSAAGHGGVSGRYKRYEETALEYAFMLEVLNGNL